MAKHRKKFMKIYFIPEILIFTVNWNQVKYFIHHAGSFLIQFNTVGARLSFAADPLTTGI